MRRTVLAILAGVVTIHATLVLYGKLHVAYRVQDLLAEIVPEGFSDGAFVIIQDATLTTLGTAPGLVVAVLFARRRGYPRGCCRGCGYDLTGN
ncbi:MAG: hypothetical protein IH897_07135, partial [Planctomycetes bacterium]|nr:hypothetical protein [Planctomycetota bacterium]